MKIVETLLHITKLRLVYGVRNALRIMIRVGSERLVQHLALRRQGKVSRSKMNNCFAGGSRFAYNTV